jgi:serine/threonine protein kinase
LLLNHLGEVKLADFGIGRRLADVHSELSGDGSGGGSSGAKEDESNGMASTFVGTQKYMSLERLRGDKYGAAADVWSLGVVLLEALLGKQPLRSDDSSLVGLIATLTDFPPADGALF